MRSLTVYTLPHIKVKKSRSVRLEGYVAGTGIIGRYTRLQG
jgi:hypothetical protein